MLRLGSVGSLLSTSNAPPGALPRHLGSPVSQMKPGSIVTSQANALEGRYKPEGDQNGPRLPTFGSLSEAALDKVGRACFILAFDLGNFLQRGSTLIRRFRIKAPPPDR